MITVPRLFLTSKKGENLYRYHVTLPDKGPPVGVGKGESGPGLHRYQVILLDKGSPVGVGQEESGPGTSYQL